MITKYASAVLAHDRVAGCMRIVDARDCTLLTGEGIDLGVLFEIRDWDTDAGWIEVPHPESRWKSIRKTYRSLRLIVLPAIAERRRFE